MCGSQMNLSGVPLFLYKTDYKCHQSRSTALEQSIKLGPEVIKLFSCLTQLSMKLQMLVSIKVSRNSAFSGSGKPRMLFSLLINVKMPRIVGILTFMSR